MPSGRPAPRSSAQGDVPGRPVSPWLDRREASIRPRLERDLDVEVAVVGGGIVGLTAALLLRREGIRVVVLEGRRIGAGVTGNTTAKVTSLHGLTYARLAAAHGEETARAYGEANEAGLATIVGLADELEIDCELRRRPNLTYTEELAKRGEIEDEVAAALAASLPASYVETTDLPFEIAAAVRFSDQAELHPLKYLDGLAAAIEGTEPRIYERTRAIGVSGDDVLVEGGRRVRAERVIVATHLPFLDRGLLFARAKPSRSFALTVRAEGPLPGGMYISTESESLRALPWDEEELLIVAGVGHTMGRGEPGEAFVALERFARDRLGATDVEHRWSAHDYESEDGLPYIGRLWPGSDRVLTASGMRKWGLAMGTTAARMMADSVLGRPSAWAEVFDPWRLPGLRGVVPLVEHNLNAGAHFLADRLAWRSGADRLAPGEGRVVGAGPRRRAVYRDEEGSLHSLSARCPHLGCIVGWNAAERTWDCPCHGSRFAPSGDVLNGPATQPLEAREPTEAPGEPG
jgi:glycine/D-amino acid oxidase-like deaminating enzyme/nitrite reductase/ring-hydroxylating ferredoxin subunit